MSPIQKIVDVLYNYHHDYYYCELKLTRMWHLGYNANKNAIQFMWKVITSKYRIEDK